jgi:hypothetical protein
MLVLVVGPWLLTRHPEHGLTAEQALKARNDVRTTLVQALGGLAVAGGLIATYRTYRLNKSQQVTDTYTKAVEQLGNDHAPVRLGALYSLAQLGQDNPQRRQMVVDVLCAYLRMPYTPLTLGEASITPDARSAAHVNPSNDPAEPAAMRSRDIAQELQVRQTAQRLLAAHLRPPVRARHKDAQRRRASPGEDFWSGISLDLTGATLVDFDLSWASILAAHFNEATFEGTAEFRGAVFRNGARFDGATFCGNASFVGATFSDSTSFVGATFSDSASFHNVTFRSFSFDDATFAGSVGFRWLTFTGDVGFGDFGGQRRQLGVSLRGTKVLHLDDRELNRPVGDPSRVWPEGWTIRPDADDPTRGTLVPTGVARQPGTVSSPPEPTGS